MDVGRKKLPVGVDSFEKLRKEDFYYIDKTGLIKELLYNWGEVTLFTRPRRFGKTLNMSMLKSFFELDGGKEIFDGLEIAKEETLCQQYMGKFPVIFISLRSAEGDNYEAARRMMAGEIQREAERFQFLRDSEKLTEHDRRSYEALLDLKNGENAGLEGTLMDSLALLSRLLQKHYDKKVVILIDEYDVPLSKAYDKGYFDKMITLIRNLFQQALKSNESLKFAVLTGCLRIAKESIFTGLNNLKVQTITDVAFDEYFGFTDREVRELLDYYQLGNFYDTIKDWYDGYHFGNMDVYCPWDVICHCDKLRTDPGIRPGNYWANTSGNTIVRHMIEMADTGTTKRELEKLIAGESVIKEIRQELTYKDLYQSIDNVWSILFTTGYLTQKGNPEEDLYELVIPNMEICRIFTKQIMDFFKETVRKDGAALDAFCNALKNGDAGEAESRFSEYLKKTISIRDTNFYHGILLGLLGFKESWVVSSNRESGSGYSDIIVEIEDESIGIVIEVKYSDNGNLEQGCREALEQIEENQYEESLRQEGVENILKYGIACYKKRCKVIAGQN